MATRNGANPSAPALSKGDCSHIIRQRGAWWLRQDSKLADMKEALSPVTDAEHAMLENRRSLNTELFPGKSANYLKKELRELGVQGSSGISGVENLAEALDAARRKGKTKEPLLDSEQQTVLDNWERHTLAVDGGPGSGKTVTLAAFVEHVLSRRPQSRVLFLSLDPYAKREITSRLQKRDITLLQKGKALASQRPSGCLVSTFALLGFWATNMPDNTSLMAKDEGRSLKQSLSMLRLLPPDDAARCWDWIVVDDAQDVSRAHGNILEFLRGQSTHLVLAGSLCQSTHQEEGAWFNTVLAECRILNEGLFLLKQNYRSSPKIVNILNAYARENFGTVYVDQIASRAGQDDDTVEFTSTPLTQQCAKMVRERLERSDPKDALAVSPVTVNACNEKLTELIQNSPSCRRPRSHCLVYSTSCSSAVQLSDLQCYVIATSRGVRGAERSRVVLYGVSETFAREGVSRSLLARLMYVAMSRAKDHLHVIADLALPDENPLNYFAFCANHKEPSPPETLVHARSLANESYRYLPRRQPGARGVSNSPQAHSRTHAENNPSTARLHIPLVRSKCYAGIVEGARLDNAMEAVTSLPRSEFFRLAHAKLALQAASYLKNSVNSAYQKMNLPPNFASQCIISVDYESTMLGMDITEIGAVAFNLDGHVLGTYQHVLPGVTVLPEYEDQNEDDEEPDSGSDAEENQESDSDVDDEQNEDQVEDEADRSEVARRIDLPLSEATKVCKEILYRDGKVVDPVSRLAADGSHGNENEDSSRPDIEKMTGLKVDDTNELKHGQRRAVRFEADRSEVARRIDLPLSEATKVCKEILYRDGKVVDPVSRLAADGSHGNENEDSSRPDIEKMTGLKVDDTNELKHGQRRAVRRFHRWANHVSDTHCFLHWSGNEPRVLDLLRGGQVYDACKLFRAWLEVEDMNRPTGQTLTDCVKQMLGPHFAFQPHRAYEDALATAAVFLALITRD